ncbi:MAG: S41 family peptidase [Clostridia bacterium]|nr:S41 family peptidase [Clostridia bacterium]
MFKSRKILSLLLVLLIIFSSTLSLSSCFEENFSEVDTDITEEEFASLSETLRQNVDAGCSKKYSYVSSYLDYWGFPKFNTVKLKTIERYYATRYIEDLGYNDSEKLFELAVKTADEYINNKLPQLTLDDVNGEVGSDEIIRAYVSAIGDKYSFYRNPTEHAAYMSDLEGEFAGIGVYVQLDYEEHTVTVIETISDSAAEKAGILAGDLIVKVDGTAATDTDLNTFMDLVKGEIGSAVSITVLRNGEEITYEMERVHVETESVAYELYDDGIAYVVISSFNANTDEQFVSIIEELEKTKKVKGYIFDVRYNGGGYLDTAVNILSGFVKKGTKIVAEVTRDDKKWYYSGNDHVISVPIVVLCNGYTASAGELFTAAIRDYRDAGLIDAVIVGETTYTKGKVQNIFPLSDGSSITLTTGLFNPPCDKNFDGEGVEPDRRVEYIPDPEVDNQYEAAYAELTSLINKK